MKWIEVTIDTTDDAAEIVSARLSMLGIDEISIVQGHDQVERIMNEAVKYWDYADDAAVNMMPAVKAYIADVPENTSLLDRITESMNELKEMKREIGIELGTLKISCKRVDEEDWANNWKAYFKPINVGEKLTVCPSWEEVLEEEGRAALRIDPGMAFGTGTHHTTRMCLELLERCINGGEIVADIGCGSGILSAAAMLMGARKAYAVDIDPVATRIAAENAALNGIDACSYYVYAGNVLEDESVRATLKKRKYDVVLANIVADVIIALTPFVSEVIHDGSIFICSGIISDRLDEVASTIQGLGFKILEIKESEDWRAILAMPEKRI